MTFNVGVPNGNQSPGVFPVQNNTNFQRLKEIINADHNFTDSAAVNQGAHKQVGLINRDTPVGLPGINGVLYSKEVAGITQLFFFNGPNDYQITPTFSQNAPTKITGTVTLNAGQMSPNLYSIPPNTQGTVFYNYIGTNLFKYYMFYRSANDLASANSILIQGSDSPTINTTSSELKVINSSATTRTIGYWINTVSF